jgi:hypothetical protein
MPAPGFPQLLAPPLLLDALPLFVLRPPALLVPLSRHATHLLASVAFVSPAPPFQDVAATLYCRNQREPEEQCPDPIEAGGRQGRAHALGWGEGSNPNRPETAARVYILPQESNEHIIPPQECSGGSSSLVEGFYPGVDWWYDGRDGYAAAAGNKGTASWQAYARS